ncbi:hypothetical protein A2532_03810 [Candidatus Wolfebacteria bacterium RIFOXYD2_FULL_48_11]|nr:MAG: hypothetical protein A2532_03810 [Candidatus Wolfebacteria bacterium RIFOXYD2_FULL_48_11]
MAIDPTETIVGFNFNFMQALFAKAQELQEAERLYEPKEGSSAFYTLSVLSAGILNHPSLQMGLSGDFASHNLTNIDDVHATLHAAEEFLAIFEKKDN